MKLWNGRKLICLGRASNELRGRMVENVTELAAAAIEANAVNAAAAAAAADAAAAASAAAIAAGAEWDWERGRWQVWEEPDDE